MSEQLFSLFRARGWGLQSAQQAEVPFLAANSSVVLGIVPAQPYSGMVVHKATIYNTPPNAFEINLAQTDIAASTTMVSTDVMGPDGIPVWIWVDNSNALYLRITNRTAFPIWMGLTLHTLVFRTFDEMSTIRRRLTEEYPYGDAILPPTNIRGTR